MIPARLPSYRRLESHDSGGGRGTTIEPSVSVPTATDTGWRQRQPPTPISIRRDCDRARKGCGTVRRERSSRWWSEWTGGWPTRSCWPWPTTAPRPPSRAATPESRGAIGPSSPASPRSWSFDRRCHVVLGGQNAVRDRGALIFRPDELVCRLAHRIDLVSMQRRSCCVRWRCARGSARDSRAERWPSSSCRSAVTVVSSN